MVRPKLEVADIFRRYGEAYRQQHDGSLSTAQQRVMTAIEVCRTILPLCTAELSLRSPPSSIEQSPAACSLFGSSDSSNKTHRTPT